MFTLCKKAAITSALFLAFCPLLVTADPFNNPFSEQVHDGLDQPIDAGSDSIIVSGSAREVLEEDAKSHSVSALFGAIEIPLLSAAQMDNDYTTTSANEFNFKISVGYGLIENPLLKRDDIKVNVFPEFSYYGDKFYVENFVVGYGLVEDEKLMFDVVGYFNDDGYFFELDGIEEITVSSILGRSPVFTPISGDFETKNLERDLSYMAGLNTTYRGDWLELQVKVATDITSVHHGQEAKVELTKPFFFDQGMLSFSVSSTLKSSEINDYYYLIKDNEFTRVGQDKSLGSSVTQKLEMHFGYRFSEKLSANVLLQKNWLDKSMRESAFVEDLSYMSGFIGLSYHF